MKFVLFGGKESVMDVCPQARSLRREFPHGFYGDRLTLMPLHQCVDHLHVSLYCDGKTLHIRHAAAFIEPDGLVWRVDCHTTVDGRFLPWLFRCIQSPYYGRCREAIIFHDAACQSRQKPSWRIHLMFYNAMRASRVNPLWAFLLWFAMRALGPRFNSRREYARYTHK